jgi:hypothetical protein
VQERASAKRPRIEGSVPAHAALVPSQGRELSLQRPRDPQVPDNWYEVIGGEREGFEPDSGPEADQQATESERDSIPADPRKSP